MSVAMEFNRCINNRDLNGLSTLMTDDHCFTDTLHNTVTGKAACTEAWKGFFNTFPDYRNIFETITMNDRKVCITGRSTCTFEALNGPALWSAKTEGDKIQEWRVYTDTAQNRHELGF